MRCADTLAGLLGLALLSPLAPASEATDAAPAAANESPAAPSPTEPTHQERLRDYVDKVRAQRQWATPALLSRAGKEQRRKKSERSKPSA